MDDDKWGAIHEVARGKASHLWERKMSHHEREVIVAHHAQTSRVEGVQWEHDTGTHAHTAAGGNTSAACLHGNATRSLQGSTKSMPQAQASQASTREAATIRRRYATRSLQRSTKGMSQRTPVNGVQ